MADLETGTRDPSKAAAATPPGTAFPFMPLRPAEPSGRTRGHRTTIVVSSISATIVVAVIVLSVIFVPGHGGKAGGAGGIVQHRLGMTLTVDSCAFDPAIGTYLAVATLTSTRHYRHVFLTSTLTNGAGDVISRGPGAFNGVEVGGSYGGDFIYPVPYTGPASGPLLCHVAITSATP